MIITYRTALFLKNVIEKDELKKKKKGWTVVNCFDFLISLQLTEKLHKISWRGRTVITKLHKVAIFSIFNEETFGISTAKTVTINKPYKGNYIFPLLLTILLIYGISIDLSFTIYQHIS